IHLVNVEEAAIGAREQPRLERSDAFAYGALKIDRAAYAILRRVQRQLDDRHMRAHTRQTPLDLQTRATIRAQARRIVRVAVICAAAHTRERRQEFSERAHGG